MEFSDKQIVIFGLGYIGLPIAVVLADLGFNVIGIDTDLERLQLLRGNGNIFSEDDLNELAFTALSTGKLKTENSFVEGDVYIICVPTPTQSLENDISADLSMVWSVIDEISGRLKVGDLIIVESTCPVGSTDLIAEKLSNADVNLNDVNLAYCPERILPGNTLFELRNNHRLVGGYTVEAARKGAEFYRTFIDGQVFETDCRTAELCKLVENSYRNLNVGFANELSIVCDRMHVDVWELISLANLHPRVNILSPGVGVGGHCIAVDPKFLIAAAPENTALISASCRANDYKRSWVVEKIKSFIRTELKPSQRTRIVCMGLTFKPNIDDIRNSPALAITQDLVNDGVEIVAVEPHLSHVDGINILDISLLSSDDVLIFLVKHDVFCEPHNITKFRNSRIIDFCGVFR